MSNYDAFVKIPASIVLVIFFSVFSGGAVSGQFSIQPIHNDFMILGHANGDFDLNQKNGCFVVSDVELNLNKTEKHIPLVKGVRFGLSVPWQIESFDFIYKTGIYKVDRKLTKNNPLVFGDFKLCLDEPVKLDESDYFLTMEVIFNMEGYSDRFTTYAHETSKYNKLTTRPSVIPERISLIASAGTFDKKILASSTKNTSVTAEIKFTEFDRSSKWPPSIIVGLRQHLVRDDSFQLQFVKDKSSQPYLISSYRIIQNGEISTEKYVDEFSVVKPVKVELLYNEGAVTLRVNDSDPITVKTHLKEVAPYVLVSSGAAEISVSP